MQSHDFHVYIVRELERFKLEHKGRFDSRKEAEEFIEKAPRGSYYTIVELFRP
jgi:hypothetical protein